jgi:hypothetical protein
MEGLMQRDASMEAAMPAVAPAGPLDRKLTVQEVSNAMAGPVAAAAGKHQGWAACFFNRSSCGSVTSLHAARNILPCVIPLRTCSQESPASAPRCR